MSALIINVSILLMKDSDEISTGCVKGGVVLRVY